MKKNTERKLRLSKDTLRSLVPTELQQVGGGRRSCGATGCDCSGGGGPTFDTVGACSTLIPY